MSILQNKIDFATIVSVTRANINGDPLNGNRPREDYNGHGIFSDVAKMCIRDSGKSGSFGGVCQMPKRQEDSEL